MKPKFTEEELKQIGHRIQRQRIANKMTQDQLSEICNCSTKHIGDVERGNIGASFPLMVKIGKALGTGVDYYLADSSDQYSSIILDIELSEIMDGCSAETKLAIRDTAKRLVLYEKELRKKLEKEK